MAVTVKDLNDAHRVGWPVKFWLEEMMMPSARPAAEVLRERGIVSRDEEIGPPERGVFVKGKGFQIATAVRLVRADCQVAKGIDGRLWRYVDGVWRPDGGDWIAERVRRMIGHLYQHRHIAHVTSYFADSMAVIGNEDDGPDTRAINLMNGMLDWLSGQLRDHAPGFYSTTRIPVRWVPGATCPKIDQFLDDVLPKDAIDFVLEVMGYLLIPDNRFQKAIMLLGPGGAGKSQLLHLMRGLIGRKNVSAIPLQALSEDRFMVAQLFGRLANIFADLDTKAVERSSMFKTIVGGDEVHGQHKNKDPFFFHPYCRLLFSANRAPLSFDEGTGYLDKWLVLPMTNVIRGTQRDVKDYWRQLVAPPELEGLLQRVVPALRRLMKRDRFEVPDSVREATRQYAMDVSSVRPFVESRCELHPVAFTKIGDLYDAYLDYCAAEGVFHVMAKGEFRDTVPELFPQIKYVTIHGVRGWRGVQVKQSIGSGQPSPEETAYMHK